MLSGLVLFPNAFATSPPAFLCHFRGLCHFTGVQTWDQLLTLNVGESWQYLLTGVLGERFILKNAREQAAKGVLNIFKIFLHGS